MDIREAYFSDTEVISASAAVGRVSADSLAAYPPGVPNVLPGEVFTSEVLKFLKDTAAAPYGYVRGALDATISSVRVVRR
jgi:arginine/lysine/ornithine decarboxylase